MPAFSEKSLCEDYFIRKLKEKGWNYVEPNSLQREGLEEALLTANLVRAVRRINSEVGEEEIKQVINELKLRGSGIEDAKKILNYLKYGILVKFEKERVVKYVRLIDYDDLAKNEFIISNQVTHATSDKQIRNDILLYVNGIPLVNIECKNPANFAESWYNAFTQIKEYERTIPELYKYVQIGLAAREKARYFAITPWLSENEVKTHLWRDDDKDEIDSAIEMLSPFNLLNIIGNYLFFRIEYGKASKVIARYMQYRAAEKICKRVIEHTSGRGEKNKGLVWHWQGSGKTLTMIFAANKLYRDKELQNPTIFFIIDRDELEEQLVNEFNSLDITRPDRVYSIEELRRIFEHDEAKGKRGIIITLIQKFRPDELYSLQQEIEKLSNERETILTRKNVIAFVDEGHRTQYGTLASQMRGILKNATFFAFTGTPIAKKGRDTYAQFSYPPDEVYLDKYFIVDSINDGFTLKIVYQPRLEKDVHLNRQQLDAFLDVEFDELPEELKGDVEESLKQKMNTIKLVLENPERIKKVAHDAVNHFKENVDGRFKAVIVAASRRACVLYKTELDQLLPKEYSEVVMTFNRTDPERIRNYHEELAKRFPAKDDGEIRREIIRRYKEEEFPKILIVTDMLLTGFDAPILQTMYLDKPLKEHRLLQAIARTNRPYGDVKEAGLIIDYVGILKNFVRAFEMYSKDDIKGALFDIEDMRREFVDTMQEILDMFKGIDRSDYSRENMERIIEILTEDEANSKKFLDKYKVLRKDFELLGPDEVKLEKFSDYKWISAIYAYYYNTVLRTPLDDAERYARTYFKKTLQYVYKSTELENFQKNLPSIAFDSDYLKNLEEKVKSKEEKAANIVFALNRFVLVDKARNPIYESLSERVEKILQLWKEKTKDYEKIYNEGAKIINEINLLQNRRKELGFDDLGYSILLTLENNIGKDGRLVDDVRALRDQLKSKSFRGWYLQQSARKEVEREVRKFLRGYVKRYGLKMEQLDRLFDKVMGAIYEYSAYL
ncbi:MAG: HsdR family type I site-specific deoxyribonuclease [Conexivisphaerales archaeon]